jgi:hypothetical protein
MDSSLPTDVWIFPEFQIRVNFTINSLNVQDLKNDGFWSILDEAQVWPDVIQLRPIQHLFENKANMNHLFRKVNS